MSNVSPDFEQYAFDEFDLSTFDANGGLYYRSEVTDRAASAYRAAKEEAADVQNALEAIIKIWGALPTDQKRLLREAELQSAGSLGSAIDAAQILITSKSSKE